MFDPKSRYKNQIPYVVHGADGRPVRVIAPVLPRPGVEMGIHRRKDYERLDHLAAEYLDDAAGYWRLLDRNDALHADALAEASEVSIPRPEQ